MKKGGSAKGELVLAIYELANCFRNGWGVGKDPAAARQYYETAANLGDADAMNEVAWCYLEGFGGKKDKVRTFCLQTVAWLTPWVCSSRRPSTSDLRREMVVARWGIHGMWIVHVHPIILLIVSTGSGKKNTIPNDLWKRFNMRENDI